ncbi:MAG: pilus assembly protein PilM [bacterium]|nr:pilus assembly protein PilM [bacterium]
MAPKGYVGITFTEDRIEAVLPATSDGTIQDVFTYPLPPDVVDEEGNVQNPDVLASTLKEAWRQLKLKSKKVLLVADSRSAIVRLVRLPHLPLNMLGQAILSEAEQYALFRNDTPSVDYFPAADEGDFINICYAAAADSLIKSYDKVFKAAGLKLQGIDLIQMAGLRGMAYYHPPEDRPWIGILLLNQRLVVSSWFEGRITAIRELVLPERENVSMELIAINYLPDAIRSVASMHLDSAPQLVFGAQRIEEARELAEHAANQISLSIHVAEPEEVDPDDELPTVVALGAGLWGRSDTLKSFNVYKPGSGGGGSLNLPKIPGLEKIQDQLQAFVLPVLGILGFYALMVSGLVIWLNVSTEQLRPLKAKLDAATLERDALVQKINETPPDAQVLEVWLPPPAEANFATGFLGRLRDMTPADAWVERVSYDEQSGIRLRGKAMTQSAGFYFADELGRLKSGNGRIKQVKTLSLEKFDGIYAYDIMAEFGPRKSWSLQQ